MKLDELIKTWQEYLVSLTDWELLTKGIKPKIGGCGKVYEIPMPLGRTHESFAIADMRSLKFAEPHYHTNGETEIYFVLQGTGLNVVGTKEQAIEKGSVIVIPPDTAHFTIPETDLVLALVNTPPFHLRNSIGLTESNKAVHFDKAQFDRLTKDL